MAVVRIVFLLALWLSSGVIIGKTLLRFQMRRAYVMYQLLFVASALLVPLYLGGELISARFGSIYNSESLWLTFLLMQVEWLTVPLAVFKTISIGSAIFAAFALIAATVLLAETVCSISRHIGAHRAFSESGKPCRFARADRLSVLSNNRFVFLRLCRMLD